MSGIPDSGIGKFLLVESRIQNIFAVEFVESWALESAMQLKDSGIPLSIGIQNPSSSDKESEIHDVESTSKTVLNPLHGAKSRFHLIIVVDKSDYNCFIPLPPPSHSLQNANLVKIPKIIPPPPRPPNIRPSKR